MIKMPFLLLIGMVLLGCQSPRVYLVRHAEKSTTPAGNPELTEAGKQRAQDLCKAIPTKSLNAIYSTNFTRTLQTATPIAKQAGLSINLYSPDTASKIVKKAFADRRNTLIVGHSNTLLPLLKNVGLEPSIAEIVDSDYDNLFIIKQRRGRLKLQERTYGKVAH